MASFRIDPFFTLSPWNGYFLLPVKKINPMQCLIISGLLDFSFVLSDPFGALPHPVHSSKYQYFIYPYPFFGEDDLDTDFFYAFLSAFGRCLSPLSWIQKYAFVLNYASV